jgi:hypothetical protein
MRTSPRLIFALGAVASLLFVTVPASANNGRKAGGVATMVTKDLAEFMAEAALKNAIANHGWKAAEPIKLDCKDETLTTTCTARRRACD